MSFFDQTAVTTAIPSIAEDLGHSSLITSWVGTAYLVANTNFQLLYGRFSDIFGRKVVFLFSLACLLIGNLVSGFSTNPVMLFVFRGVSGLGGGGINCLVMITFADLLTTRQRGKYFGFVAVSTTLGNGIGPLLGGVLSEKADWRWTFWISCPIAVVCAGLIVFFVPLKLVTGSFKSKLKTIDWWGFLCSVIGIMFVLVAISGGGVTWEWDSPTFIVLIIIGSVGTLAFFAVEFFAAIPMIPLNLFAHFQRLVLFTMCFLMGWAYYVDIYYFPLYLQHVRHWSPIQSGLIQLPATCSSSIFGVIAGFINSKTGEYVKCLYFGGAMWCLGTGLKIMFDLDTSLGLLIGSNLIQGLGIGFTFQPTLLSLLNHSDSKDRAVVTGLRNFFRCFGGSVGLIIGGLIFNSIFRERLMGITQDMDIIESILADPAVMASLPKEIESRVVYQYLLCYRYTIITLTSLSGVMFVISLATRDTKELEITETREITQEKDTTEQSVVAVDSASLSSHITNPHRSHT